MNTFQTELILLQNLQEEYRLSDFGDRETELLEVLIPEAENKAWTALFELYSEFKSAKVRYTFLNSFRANTYLLEINGVSLPDYYKEDLVEFRAWLVEQDLKEELITNLNLLHKEMSVKHIISRSAQGRGSHEILYTRPR